MNPILAWAVQGPTQVTRRRCALVFWPTRKAAIASACWLALASSSVSGWPSLRRAGWRVVRVRIEQVAP